MVWIIGEQEQADARLLHLLCLALDNLHIWRESEEEPDYIWCCTEAEDALQHIESWYARRR